MRLDALIACRVPREIYDELHTIASREGVSLAQVVRELVEWRIAYERAEPLPFPHIEEKEFYASGRRAAE